LDECRNRALRIDQRAPGTDVIAVNQHDADLGDAVEFRIGACGFQVDESESLRQHE